MDYEKRLEAYEKASTLDDLTLRNLRLKAFLDKHVYLRDALNSSYLQGACYGAEQALQDAFDKARDIMPALIKEGLEPASEEEYLQAVLDFQKTYEADGKYTVLSYSEESGRIYSDHVVAKDRLNAFAVAAKMRLGEPVAFVACMDGHLEEDKQVTFPGDSTVDGETVIEQTDVFGEG